MKGGVAGLSYNEVLTAFVSAGSGEDCPASLLPHVSTSDTASSDGSILQQASIELKASHEWVGVRGSSASRWPRSSTASCGESFAVHRLSRQPYGRKFPAFSEISETEMRSGVTLYRSLCFHLQGRQAGYTTLEGIDRCDHLN
jgi:hypothetical protein